MTVGTNFPLETPGGDGATPTFAGRSPTVTSARVVAGFFIALSTAQLACRAEDLVAVAEPSGAGGGGAGGAALSGGTAGAAPHGASAGAAATSADPGSLNCSQEVPLATLASADGARTEVATARLATQAFSHALCVCGEASVPGALLSDVTDSGSLGRGRGGAAVGINGSYTGGAEIRLDGGFKSASQRAVTTSGSLRLTGDLWLAGPANVGGLLSIARDAWLTQDTTVNDVARVEGDLHTGATGTLSSAQAVEVLGATTAAPFTFDEPCGCDPEELLDIAGLVEEARTLNDNDAIELSADSFEGGLIGILPTRVELPSGRYFLETLRPTGGVRLEVRGKAALFVAGDVETGEELELDLSHDAELDLFIGGNLVIDSEARLGNIERPAALRIYVQGEQDIRLPGTRDTSLNLYAPRAAVAIDGTGDVHGSLFVRAVSANPDLFLHYDVAITRAGDVCEPQAGTCQPCAQCSAGAACFTSACFQCATDSDCCAPFVCAAGTCGPLVPD